MARKTTRPAVLDALAPTMTSALSVCVAVALAMLGYIRLKADLNRLYGDINRWDRQLAEVRRFNQKLSMDYEVLTSPKGLNTRLRELDLDLVMPGEDARVVLPEPPEDTPVSSASGAVAHRTAGPITRNHGLRLMVSGGN